jgi:hypothetical protein
VENGCQPKEDESQLKPLTLPMLPRTLMEAGATRMTSLTTCDAWQRWLPITPGHPLRKSGRILPHGQHHCMKPIVARAVEA